MENNDSQKIPQNTIFKKIVDFLNDKNGLFLKSIPLLGIIGSILLVLGGFFPYAVQRGKYYSLGIDLKFRINNDFNINEGIFSCVIVFAAWLIIVVISTFNKNDDYYQRNEIIKNRSKLFSFIGRIAIILFCLFTISLSSPGNNKFVILLGTLIIFLLLLLLISKITKIKQFILRLIKDMMQFQTIKDFLTCTILWVIAFVATFGMLGYVYGRLSARYLSINRSDAYKYVVEIDNELKIVVDQNAEESIVCNIIQKNEKYFPDCEKYLKKIENYNYNFISIKND